MNDLAVIVTLVAAAAGGMLAGRAAVAVDARASGVTALLPRSSLLAGTAGLALVALALADARGALDLDGAGGLALVSFGAAFLRGAVRIVGAEERREHVALLVTARRRRRRRRAA